MPRRSPTRENCSASPPPSSCRNTRRSLRSATARNSARPSSYMEKILPKRRNAHDRSRKSEDSLTSMATTTRRSLPVRARWVWRSSSKCPDLDAVVIPVGGGGLLAGVALAVKSLRPQTKVIAVEADHVASFSAAMQAGKPVRIEMQADARGRARDRAGGPERLCDRGAADRSHRRCQRRTNRRFHSAHRRAGERSRRRRRRDAAGRLSFRTASRARRETRRPPSLRRKHRPERLEPRRRARARRRWPPCRFTAVISDRPGGLADLATEIASTGASIKQVVHDRAFAGSDVSAVHVLCTVETRNHRASGAKSGRA